MKCAIFHCDNELSSKARLTVCQGCRNVFHYWEQPGRGVVAIIRRQGQLEKWQARMKFMADNKPRFRRAGQYLPDTAARPVVKPRVKREPVAVVAQRLEQQATRRLSAAGFDRNGQRR